MDILSDQEIDEKLQGCDGWSRQDNTLHKKFIFNDFIGAFGFMTKVAMGAEKQNHHPLNGRMFIKQ